MIIIIAALYLLSTYLHSNEACSLLLLLQFVLCSPVGQILLFPIYKEDTASEKSSNLPKVTQLISEEARIRNQPGFKTYIGPLQISRHSEEMESSSKFSECRPRVNLSTRMPFFSTAPWGWSLKSEDILPGSSHPSTQWTPQILWSRWAPVGLS